jgi:DNA recombination protein RmuC
MSPCSICEGILNELFSHFCSLISQGYALAMNSPLLLLLGLILGLGLGAVVGWLLKGARVQEGISELQLRIEQSQSEVQRMRDELQRAKEESGRLGEEVQCSQEEARKTREEGMLAQARLSETLLAQFRNLATEVLEERSKVFSQSSSEKIGGLLSPLQQQLESFRKRVEEVHESQTKNSTGLQQELLRLAQLNTQLSDDASNLASALKGDSQRRGAWGELILERTLELSGLERGREFELQVSTDNRLRPDAVIHLPEGRFIVVDSKVSLLDYERSCNATEEPERQRALLDHVAAVRQHIKSLSEKGYPDLFEGKTPEVVMMFLPIEPAFGAALSTDPRLFEFAFSHRVILVTPSTLLAALRTVTNVWKVEKQTKNVLEIARLGGVLHDKLADFAKGLLGVRERLTQATTAHDEAVARLTSQKGNILGTALRLRELGAKAEKQMPQELVTELGVPSAEGSLQEGKAEFSQE